MLNPNQFRKLVIRPTLHQINLHSPEAETLLLGTAITESNLEYLKQYPKGPALGIYQMEPATFEDHWANFLRYKPAIASRIQRLAGVNAGVEAMMWNLAYATAMARVHYLRVKQPLPKDIPGMAEYWKKFFNTHMGKGTPEDFVNRAGKYLTG